MTGVGSDRLSDSSEPPLPFQTNLIGAIVEVHYRRLGRRPRAMCRGEIRAASSHEGDLIVWIEELNEAERVCWFGDDKHWLDQKAPPEHPGRLMQVRIGMVDVDSVHVMTVIREPHGR